MTKPTDWFAADTFPLLRQFCCHAEAAMQFNKLINELAGDDIGRLEKLLAQRERESKVLIRLASSMRLTQQSRIKSEKAAAANENTGDADKPWLTAVE